MMERIIAFAIWLLYPPLFDHRTAYTKFRMDYPVKELMTKYKNGNTSKHVILNSMLCIILYDNITPIL